MSGLKFRIVIICFFFFVAASYAQEAPVQLSESPRQPRFQQGSRSFKSEYSQSNKDAFIRSFYNKDIDEETAIFDRYKRELIHVKLEDCIAIALHNNFKIKISNAREDQYKWSFNRQTAKFFPNFYYYYKLANLNGAFLAGGVIPTQVNETPVTDNFYLTMSVFDGGYRIFQRRAARDEYNASKQNVIFTREETLKNVATSYYRLLSHKLCVRALIRNLDEIKAQLEINQKLGGEFDILRSQAALAEAKQLLARKYGEYRIEQANFANILGVDVSDAILPSEEVITKKTLIDKNLQIEELYQISYSSRNDLEELRLRIKALENEKKSIYSNFVPHADAYASMGRVGTAKLGLISSKEVGLVVTVPLGRNMGVTDYTELKRYDALIDEAKYELQNRSRDIYQNVISSYYSIRSSNVRAFDAEEQFVASDKSLEMALSRLQNGGLYVDVLQTQVSKTGAKINLITAIADYNVAQVNQLFNTGAISVYNLTENIEPDPVKEEMDARLER